MTPFAPLQHTSQNILLGLECTVYMGEEDTQRQARPLRGGRPGLDQFILAAQAAADPMLALPPCADIYLSARISKQRCISESGGCQNG